jgi:hypothetical protein
VRITLRFRMFSFQLHKFPRWLPPGPGGPNLSALPRSEEFD